MNKGLYPIRAVSRLTGVSADNIRAWERRYGAVVPQRVKGGRLFSEADLARLRLLKRAVDHGHSIGQIAKLSNENLESLPIRKGDLAPEAKTKSPREQEIQAVFTLIQNYEVLQAEHTLSKLASFLSPQELILEVVVPLMGKVGDAWHVGNLTIAQEHAASAMIRNLLGTLMRLYRREETPRKLMFATPTGERHEFGILSSAMLAASGGLGVLYLGTDLPAQEVVEAVRKTRVSALVLGVTVNDERKEFLRDYFRTMLEDFPSRCELIVGGYLHTELRQFLESRETHIFDTLEQFQEYSRKYGAVY
ncbi:MAG: MerR family transcriptional regulator [Acidobacteriota bacterium]|nr:MerR family transcriptional regulator [Acidobacteriota bacterium]